MTTFVPREQWGAKPRKQGTTDIIDHPSVTFHYVGGGWEYPWLHSSCDDKVRGIQADHMLPESLGGRGWSDIAYNYLTCPHDFVYEGRGYDRRSSANGSDSANNLSFAICALWGTASADDPLPVGLKYAFMWARQILITKGGATSVIKGHRDWKQTDCPGDQIYAWIKAGCPLPSTGEPDMTTDASVRSIVREELALASVNGQPLHEMVQAYSAFGAKHSDQLVDDTAEAAAADTDLVLKDDFLLMHTRLDTLQQQYEGVQNTLTAILQKLNNPPA